ncbi:histidinol dehydrogenase [Muricauda sp. 2012CJ35-5]|uniref:Histidinol dehydrogenase n=1 Tax=Flagellimonas spongiicola TaxID=2942208 RepID=A0ABT0PR46_9FLAO|nr:histidinol dehydrogenase [Allomuricauda spongiicola]MCL6273446.1 histidinol dehydrogenase [Allomuricauda spongiicola]
MKQFEYPEKADWKNILQRPTATVSDIESTVTGVFKDVERDGDVAVNSYTAKFDGVKLENMLVGSEEIEEAINQVPDQLKNAIKLAKSNIEKFHSAQQTATVSLETMPGVKCWQEKRPIQKVGLYIPGGTAPLFSTILMLAVPAKIAGCKEIVLCTPPDTSGAINPAILYTAQLCGITNICKVGGIQAIAALTFGTATIPQVYKIFGPGNQYVTVAKQLATKYGVAIDMPAGPSELLVVADDTANPKFVAADLLSQAEHGVDSQVLFVSTSSTMLDSVATELELQIAVLPRKDIAKKSIANSRLILMENKEEALELINAYGPEHFIVCTAEDEFYVNNIANAGSVFVGNYTPESAGDYASGTNHTLPTNGYAKQYSGVNLDSFMKSMTFQKISEDGMKRIGNAIELMAEAEGLQAHKNAVTVRLNSLL